MPYLALDGCNLYYETHGDGPALIFAHGGAGNQLSWWQQVPHFRDRYRCVVFSQRGCGLSREHPDSIGPSAFVDDVAALVEHLGLADVRLVAQSMGGWLLLGYALREPARVKALVMSSSTGSVTHPDIDRILAANPSQPRRAALAARGILPACGERMAREQPALHYLYGQISTINVPSPLGDINVRLQQYRTTTADDLKRLDLPVLCMAGAEDILQPPDSVEVLASLIPGAQFTRVPETGHSVYWERAARFNQLVDDLLARVDPDLARTAG
jgi:pimeloyl-ACP methyl ester carboxylesterase